MNVSDKPAQTFRSLCASMALFASAFAVVPARQLILAAMPRGSNVVFFKRALHGGAGMKPGGVIDGYEIVIRRYDCGDL